MKNAKNEQATQTNVNEAINEGQKETLQSPAVQQNSLAVFDSSKKVLSTSDMVAIACSGIFEAEGTDLSAKIANAEFWDEQKGVELNIIFESIIPFESNSDDMDDTDAAVCMVLGKDSSGKVTTEKILILNSFPVSEFKKYGAGAYKITYLGKKKSTKNTMYSYFDFKIKLQGTFNK